MKACISRVLGACVMGCLTFGGALAGGQPDPLRGEQHAVSSELERLFSHEQLRLPGDSRAGRLG